MNIILKVNKYILTLFLFIIYLPYYKHYDYIS
jgi:hypothetical protein